MSALALPRLARVAFAPRLILYVACSLLWLVAGLAFPGFASLGHLRYMLEESALLGIVAAGQTLVVITAGIDLSVGAMIAFAAIFGPSISQAVGDDSLVSIVLLLTLASGVGAINGAAIAWLAIHPTILTLASATILTGVMLLISGGTAVAVQSPVVIWLAQGHLYAVSISILAWAVVAAAVTFLLRGTTLGLWLYAIGTSPRASELSDVNEKLALVVGGTSSLGGHGGYAAKIAGAILLTTVTSLITVVNVSAGWRNVMLGLLALALLALYAREGRRA